MTPLWPIDHIAHIVHDLDKAIENYASLLGLNSSESTPEVGGSSRVLPHYRETLPEHKVEVAFIDLENTSIELITPLEGNSSLVNFLNSRGEALHHICYRVDSVAVELERLKASGYRLIDKSPRPGARQTEVAFIHPSSCGGVLTEICSDLEK